MTWMDLHELENKDLSINLLNEVLFQFNSLVFLLFT